MQYFLFLSPLKSEALFTSSRLYHIVYKIYIKAVDLLMLIRY